jgi:hypothetical protein
LREGQRDWERDRPDSFCLHSAFDREESSKSSYYLVSLWFVDTSALFRFPECMCFAGLQSLSTVLASVSERVINVSSFLC